MKWQLKRDATNEISAGTYIKQGVAFVMAMIKQPKKVCRGYPKSKKSLHLSVIGKIVIVYWE